jgi:hypothetical protein
MKHDFSKHTMSHYECLIVMKTWITRLAEYNNILHSTIKNNIKIRSNYLLSNIFQEIVKHEFVYNDVIKFKLM